MTRWLAFAALLVSLPTVTDWLVDYEFRQQAAEPVGYTRQQRDAMSRLVEQAVAEPHHACGEDWLCLLAWAEEKTPAKTRRRS